MTTQELMSEREQISLKDYIKEKFELFETKLNSIDCRLSKIESETEVSRVLGKNPELRKATNAYATWYTLVVTAGFIVSILKIAEVI